MLVFDLGEACLTPRWRAQRLLLHRCVFVDVFDESTAGLREGKKKEGKKPKWEQNIQRVFLLQENSCVDESS